MLESLNEMKFIIVALNLILLYLVLRRILFKPVMEFMENRTNSIKNSIEDAEKKKGEAEGLKRTYDEQLKGLKQEGERLLEEARSRADKEFGTLMENARKEAEAIITKARAEIENERELMLKDIRTQVTGLALAAASRVIEANMDTESNRALVDKFIDEAGAA